MLLHYILELNKKKKKIQITRAAISKRKKKVFFFLQLLQNMLVLVQAPTEVIIFHCTLNTKMTIPTESK